MAVDFSQNNGDGHTCIYKFTSAITAPPMTLACWFKSEQFNITKILINLTPTSGSDCFSLRLSGGASTGTVRGFLSDFVFFDEALSASTFAFDEWHHAACVISATHITVYLDGVAGTPVAWTLTPDNVGFIVVGGWGTLEQSTFGFQGCIALAGAWGTDLGADQIASLAAGAHPNTISGSLVAELKLLNEETATHETGSGSEWTLFEAVGSDGIATCATSPVVASVGSSYVRIMG